MTATATLSLGLLVGACSGGHGSYGSAPPGTVFLHENEPNDQASEANFFGSLAPGDHLLVEGELAGFFPDIYDGFAFTASQPIRVEFYLYHSGFDDFDVCVYDPELFGFVGCYETGANPETGFVDILATGQEFHLVVTPYTGGGSYELELFVSGLPLPAPFSADEPAADEASSTIRTDAPVSEREPADRSAYFADSLPAPPVAPVRVLLIDPESGAVSLIEEEQGLAPVERE